ncbi:MAG: metalloregulator ArsR/SmtB family transcription factor [Gemmatimonadota bacterium]|nr:metalloregulator ArsR/SmtB family transcription factor [Gemmatimonadota bacterium]
MTPTKGRPRLLRGIDPALLTRAADTIRVLGHPDRIKIVEVLEERDATVSEIQDEVELSQPIVSQHLARLRAHGIVDSTRDGQHVIYSLVEPKVEHILRCIRQCDL